MSAMENRVIKSEPQKILCLCLIFVTLRAVTAGNEPGPGDVTVVVSEGSEVILPCSLSTKESVVQKLFDWRKNAPNKQEVFMYDAGLHYNNGLPGQDEQFKGRVSHFPQDLQFGNASIRISNTKVTDSGDYTCAFPRLQPEQTFNIKLVVELTLKDRSAESPGAAAKPHVGFLNITEDKALLHCEVRGAFPEPLVEWQDSDGHTIAAKKLQGSAIDGRYDITLLATVTKSKYNSFRCVARQEDIGHVIDAEINVTYNENLVKDTSGKVSIGWLFSTLFLGALILAEALLVATKRLTISFNRGCPENTKSPSKKPSKADSEGGSGDGELNPLNNGLMD